MNSPTHILAFLPVMMFALPNALAQAPTQAPATSPTMGSAAKALPELTLPSAKPAAMQASPWCPDGVCPGLGNSFYLPDVNALSINTGGNNFFKDRKLGECALMSTVAHGDRSFKSADSMQRFISNTMAEANLSGSYKTAALSVKGTAEAMTGMSSDILTSFHSVYLDISVVNHTVDFKQDSTCFSEANIDPSFLNKFESLAMIGKDKAGGSESWHPYVQFLKDQGSHVLMQQQIGSRFQQWESSDSADSQIENTLKAKACAEVEGTVGGGGWSVTACGAYSSDDKKKAQSTSATSRQVVLGGTTKARAALLKDMNKKTMDAFIDSANKGDQPTRFIFKPIWQLLDSIYSPACAAAGVGSKACGNLQRAVNLQAAFEGWTAIGCEQLSSGGKVYQTMAVAGTTTMGVNTYQCKLSKTGCKSNDSCHLGGAGSVCYCYGPDCIDQGDPVSGTPMFRNKVRGSQAGGYGDGVNGSCYYKFIAHCNCDTNWSGGLAERTLYLQSSSD